MVNRIVRKADLGGGRTRHRVLITGDDCPTGSQSIKAQLYVFMEWISANKYLLECGYNIPSKIIITHNGTCWQAEAEVEVDDPTTQNVQ